MPRALLVTGLCYGDEGKGSIVDWLVRQTGAKLVVRHNGGAQAAHNVVLPDGRHHTFAQWGAGTFVGARTFLSRYMIVDPLAMVKEAEHLISVGVADPWSLMMVDERALVITPYHRAANRLREMARGDDRHGSCGMGVGEAYEDRDKPAAIRFGDLVKQGFGDLGDKLREVQAEKLRLVGGHSESAQMLAAEPAVIADRMSSAAMRVQLIPWSDERAVLRGYGGGDVVFEGAQGVLLDQYRGVQPYTTWSNTTSEQARAMLEGAGFEVTKIGVARAYLTRHGPGPLKNESRALTDILPDPHNGFGEWQRHFRCGVFDAPLVRHAIGIEGGIDHLALTCVDRLARTTAVSPWEVVDGISAELGFRPSIVSAGPTHLDKTQLRDLSPR
jgi:adenylosuccinate synthase